MIRIFVAALVLALVPTAAFAQTEEDAGDVSEVDKDRVGPLRERVRPVSGHLFLKRGRFEFSPSITSSFNDPFFWKFLAGVTVGYFPWESLGVNLRLGIDAPTLATGQMVVSPAAQICQYKDEGAGLVYKCESPTYLRLDGNATGQLTFLAGVDAQYAPIYGKIGLVGETFLHFDLYALAGASFIGYKGPSATGTGEGIPMITPGVNLGVGARFVAAKWFAVRTEFRDLLYNEKARTPSGSSLRSQFLFELGFSLFFPTTFARE
jgi:outer membrane beta-barrel protein